MWGWTSAASKLSTGTPSSESTLRDGAERLRALTTIAARAAQRDGARPTRSDEQEISAIMDNLRPAHLALQTPQPTPASPDGVVTIRTQTICHNADLDLVIFIFPAGASIPLHNHPGMTVFSKVLYGTLAMRAYDWETPPSLAELEALTAEISRQESPNASTRSGPPLAPPRPARLRVETVLTPETPTYCLRPHFSNVHAFEARTACAVLDLLVPPYSDDDGRDCHYFVEGGGPAEGGATGSVMLAPKAPPDSLVIKGMAYGGLPILLRPAHKRRAEDAPVDVSAGADASA